MNILWFVLQSMYMNWIEIFVSSLCLWFFPHCTILYDSLFLISFYQCTQWMREFLLFLQIVEFAVCKKLFYILNWYIFTKNVHVEIHFDKTSFFDHERKDSIFELYHQRMFLFSYVYCYVGLLHWSWSFCLNVTYYVLSLGRSIVFNFRSSL